MTATTRRPSSPPTRSGWYRGLTAHLADHEPYGPGWHATYTVTRCGETVGLVERDHRFTGSRIVQTPHFHAACRMDRSATDAACWNTHRAQPQGHPSIRLALRALYDHIVQEHRHSGVRL